MQRFLFSLFITSALALLCAAQQPKVINGKVVPRTVTGTLEHEVATVADSDSGPEWNGYAVPVIPGERQMCCFDFNHFRRNPRCCGGCRLESGKENGSFIGKTEDCRQLEPAKVFFALLRVENHQIQKVRAYSVDCQLDLGTVAMYWLSGVKAGESVSMLERLINAHTPLKRSSNFDLEETISAIALHSDAAADAALDRLVLPGKPDNVRGHAAFWLGSSRGHHGFEAVRNLLRNESETDALEQFVFALSESDDPLAQP